VCCSVLQCAAVYVVVAFLWEMIFPEATSHRDFWQEMAFPAKNRPSYMSKPACIMLSVSGERFVVALVSRIDKITGLFCKRAV